MRKLLFTIVALFFVGGVMAQIGAPNEKTDQKENPTKSKCSYEQNIADDKDVEKACCKKRKGTDSSSRSPWWNIFEKGKNVITNTVRIKKDVIWGRKINKKGAPKKLDQ